jgi:deazaflavin-dependent oxidoreductase (nitroreductase family)
MTETFKAGGPDWQKTHLDLYLSTNGTKGHAIDFSELGGLAKTPCLILEATGRQSGKQQRVPLIYGTDGKRFVIVASKGGAEKHPAWFLNLEAKPEVKFQVGSKKYRGVAHIAKSPERERLFKMMAGVYLPYVEYQTKTAREIPVVVLEPQAEIEKL